tara:strand:- start:4919 stop:5713 length:795 start_codon:yes stop_codon:yes gene_type:complete
MKTYVIHYDKLKHRKESLELQLKQNDLNADWLIQKGFYSKEFIDKYFKFSVSEWKRKVRIAKRPIIYRPLTKSEIHLTINHFLVGERISRGEDDIALVFEDDAVLIDNFKEVFRDVLKQLNKATWDIAYLDFLGGKPPKVDKLTLLDHRNDNDYYGTCAYLIKRSTWNQILAMNEKFTLPSDEELKYRINHLGLKSVWILPPLVKQSSLNGLDNADSGQDQREIQGIKRYIFWRKKIYKIFPRKVRDTIDTIEEKIKKLILGIN